MVVDSTGIRIRKGDHFKVIAPMHNFIIGNVGYVRYTDWNLINIQFKGKNQQTDTLHLHNYDRDYKYKASFLRKISKKEYNAYRIKTFKEQLQAVKFW